MAAFNSTYFFQPAPDLASVPQYTAQHDDQPSLATFGSQLSPVYGLDFNPLFYRANYFQYNHPQYHQPSYGYPSTSLALDNDIFYNHHAYASDPLLSQPPPPDPHHRPFDLPLHAPVPLSCASPTFLAPFQPPSFSPLTTVHAHSHHLSWSTPSSSSAPAPADVQDLMEHYANIPREIFPTPSELLSVITEDSPQPPSKNLPPPARSTHLNKEETTRGNETLRQARLRYMAESIGFHPTDPDGMSGHDKKRSYLECLEEYVVYLRDQATLAGLQPLELERVSTYRGLNSRSIRTMIIHMEDNVRAMHQNMLQEEATFLELRDQVLTLEAKQARELHRRLV